ncbi:MAG: hypothetical protein U9R74_00840 [Pseudomonadota bacterium]|nr:hypothetical protein [Pseudomonadota bacterium]
MAKRKTKNISNPSITREITFDTEFAQRVYRRIFVACSRALFVVDVVLRVIGTDEEFDQVDKLVIDKLQGAHDDLAAEIERLEEMAEARSVSQAPSYSFPKTVRIEITSPRANQFLGLIVQYDRFVSLLDTLWLNGVLDGKQRTEGSYAWQNHLIVVGRSLMSIKGRAMEAASRRGKSEEVEKAIDEIDQAVDDSVDQSDSDSATDTVSS